ncbi:AAA family ATPase [Asanoa sp. WMMD1127]|uniref:ATP-binding protein n=1 Tax=Asanoa sp. WMMD1127 TaxID=3016107 RepID=UPI002416F015|nr:AAA family ATPase [Asanoa sp. WMMD1127]MDG4825879.1 AAA family ATPase [Asanoa sp. WMMD1127]
MRQVLCPVLVGRDAEVDVLHAGLRAAADGHGGAFFVMGEPGVGKSRLAREAARLARSSGLTVLSGRSVAGGVPPALRPLAEAVLGALRGRGEIDAGDLHGFRPVLGRLVPQWLPADPAPETASPVLLGEGLLRLIRALGGGGRGCLLVLEDLHWADAESLAVLEYLADNVADERTVCLGTLRPESAGAGRELVDRLVDRRAATVIELGGLPAAAVAELARTALAAAALPAEVTEFLVERADGLPFLVEELLAGLVGAGVLVERDGCWVMTGRPGGGPPRSFADGVRRRVAGLATPAGEVLRAAAVLGREVDWSLLPALTGRPAAEVAALLRPAVAAQLVTADGGAFRFRHALTRDAVLADLLPPERATLAAQALATLLRIDPELTGFRCELAAELAEAAGDRPRAAELLVEVGRRAVAAGALASAEATLRRAGELVDDPTTRIPVDDALTEVFALTGQVDLALDLGQRLLARLDVRSGPRVAALHLRLARAGVAAGRWPLAVEHLAAARGLAGVEPHLAARVDALEAQVALGQGRLDDAGRLAATALAVAERAGLAELACEALEVVGRVARQRDLRGAEAAFARELAVATAHGLRLWRLRALHELGTVAQLRTESVDELLAARGLAVEVGALALVATLDLQIAAGLVKQFRADEGLAAASRSVDASRSLRLATLPMALVQAAAAHAQRGRADEMAACLAEASALAPDDLDVRGSAWGHCRATASLLAEDRGRALAEMTTGARLLRSSPATVAPPFLGLRILLLAVDGDAATARMEADTARASAAIRHQLVASLLGYAEAVLLGRSGHAARAETAFHAADAEMGPLVEWHRQYARRLAAEAALADGWGAPVRWLREAAAFFAAAGHGNVAAGCRALLRGAGAPVPRTARTAGAVPADLRALGVTAREADVLALVVEGLTNRELAARLHLSPRTVEKHVASLLAKTGSRRRAQLAGYSARLSG